MFPRFVNVAPSVIALGLLMALPSSAAAQPDGDRAPVQLEVSPEAFSPNHDGRLDLTTITVGADQTATVRIEILGRRGALVRQWTEPVTPSAPVSIPWDGTSEDGALVPDGEYVVRARGEGPLDLVEEAQTPVSVDTLRPGARWGPSPVLTTQKKAAFAFRATDASKPLRVRLEIEDRDDPIGSVEASVLPGDARIAWRARAPRGGSLFPGTYFASLTVRDAAGNQSRLSRAAWRVHTPTRARVVRSVPGAGRRVALTIDDCHYPDAWSRMLRTLREREAGATFFCPGKQILANPGLVRRTIRDGHEIGAHGWDHAVLEGRAASETSTRLRADADALWRVARRSTAPYFRPPEGAYDSTVVAAAGLTGHPLVVMWDVDPQDWRRPGVEAITYETVREAHPGSIVVLHTLDQTATALPAIISGLRDRGLEPVGLGALLEAGRSRRPGAPRGS